MWLIFEIELFSTCLQTNYIEKSPKRAKNDVFVDPLTLPATAPAKLRFAKCQVRIPITTAFK